MFSVPCFRWWKRLVVFPVFVATCARHNLQYTLLFFMSDFKKQKYLHTTKLFGPFLSTMSSLMPWAVSSIISSEGVLIVFFYTAAAAQTNTPRLAAGMALFQPRDWFSAVQLSLSLAIRIVCQKMDECNLSKKYIDHVSYLYREKVINR